MLIKSLVAHGISFNQVLKRYVRDQWIFLLAHVTVLTWNLKEYLINPRNSLILIFLLGLIFFVFVLICTYVVLQVFVSFPLKKKRIIPTCVV